MTRRYKECYDDTDSDSDVPRSGRGSRSTASRKGSGDFGLRGRKEPSRPWSQEESEWLIKVVSKTSANIDNINWQEIAKQVPGRTGKQCREKWKNDLRPNICKDPWSLKEEYVLAMAHSIHGNRWSEVAKYLPTRPENTIKNRWYATNRAKAEVKIRTFLWLYSDLVDRQSYPAGPEAIEKARDLYRQLPDVVPLEEFEVPVDFYIRSGANGDSPAALDTRPEIKIIGRGKAKQTNGANGAGGGAGGGGASPAGSARGAGRAGGAARPPRAGGASAAAGAAAAAGSGGGVTAAAGTTTAMSPSRAVTTGATALVNRGVGGCGASGTGSGGGGHSEGDANCYVKVEVGGLVDSELLPVAGPAKTPGRKRKAVAAAVGGNADGTTVDSPPMSHKLAKTDAAGFGAEHHLGAYGGDADAAVSMRVVLPKQQEEGAHGGGGGAVAAGGGRMTAASPAVSGTAAAPGGGAAAVGADGGGGAAAEGSHGYAPLDPELLWQTAMEPYNNSNPAAAPRGRRGSSTRMGGPAPTAAGSSSGGAHPSSAAAAGAANGGGAGRALSGPTSSPYYPSGPGGTASAGDPHSLQPFFMMGPHGRLPGSEGGGSASAGAGASGSAADLAGMFRLGPGSGGGGIGMGMGLLEDTAAAGPVPDHDPDLLALTDGLDLASLTALMGAGDMPCDVTNDAHEAMAGLAADVLSQLPPDPATPRGVPNPQQHPHHPHHLHHPHHQPHYQHYPHHPHQPQTPHPPPPHMLSSPPSSGAPHPHPPTITTPPPSLHPSLHTVNHMQQHYHHPPPPQQQQHAMAGNGSQLKPVRHSASLGSGTSSVGAIPGHHQQQQQQHPQAGLSSMGSYPAHPGPQSQQQQQQHPHQHQQQHQQHPQGGSLQTLESGCQPQLPPRGSVPMPPSSSTSTAQRSPSSSSMPGGGPAGQQPMLHPDPPQLPQQLQQQQQHQYQQGGQDVGGPGAGYHPAMVPGPAPQGYLATPPRRMPAGVARGPPPPGHMAPYGSPPPYMTSPHAATAGTAPSMHPRGMHPAMAGAHGAAAAAGAKYGMPPYGSVPPPGAPYGVAGPPPPYMMPMGMRGGYYKVPGARPVPRGMMPYPPYGMPVYPPHAGMQPGYMEAVPQSQQQQQQHPQQQSQQQQQQGPMMMSMAPGAADGGAQAQHQQYQQHQQHHQQQHQQQQHQQQQAQGGSVMEPCPAGVTGSPAGTGGAMGMVGRGCYGDTSGQGQGLPAMAPQPSVMEPCGGQGAPQQDGGAIPQGL